MAQRDRLQQETVSLADIDSYQKQIYLQKTCEFPQDTLNNAAVVSL